MKYFKVFLVIIMFSIFGSCSFISKNLPAKPNLVDINFNESKMVLEAQLEFTSEKNIERVYKIMKKDKRFVVFQISFKKQDNDYNSTVLIELARLGENLVLEGNKLYWKISIPVDSLEPLTDKWDDFSNSQIDFEESLIFPVSIGLFGKTETNSLRYHGNTVIALIDYKITGKTSLQRQAEQLKEKAKADAEKKQAKLAQEQTDLENLYKYGWNLMKKLVESDNKDINSAFASVHVGMGMISKLTDAQKDWVLAGAKDYYDHPFQEPRY